MRRKQSAILAGILILCLASLSSAQTAATNDGQQALTLATQATAALTRGIPITDVTLQANVTWIAGSDYLTGTGTFQAKGPSESRFDLKLGDTTRTEVHTTTNGIPQGEWMKAATTSAIPEAS
jgi:hypothetical protein